MTPVQAVDLLTRYRNDECTPAELELVEAWFAELERTGEWEGTDAGKDRIGFEIKSNIQNRIYAYRRSSVRRKSIRWLMAAAAMFVFLLGSWLVKVRMNGDKGKNDGLPIARTGRPGSDKAILTLADGSRITLDSTVKGRVAIQKGVTVIKADSGLLAYNGAGGGPTAFNTLTVPRGGRFQIVLPDGSHVWLNSASSLTYPTEFGPHGREVDLKGEGYFEVKTDAKKHFSVRSGGVRIEALGTGFDVMAYSDEAQLKVTLAQGTVAVGEGNGRTVLRPGQQAIAAVDIKTFSVGTVNVDEVLAWKEGEFWFNETDIATVMRQIERWYDVEIVYEGARPDTRISGVIPRKSEVSDLLAVLEGTGKVHCRQEGNRIIVTKPKS